MIVLTQPVVVINRIKLNLILVLSNLFISFNVNTRTRLSLEQDLSKHFTHRQLGEQFSAQGEKIIASQAIAGEYTNYLHLRPQKVTGNDVGSNTRRYICKEHTTQTDVSCFKTTCTSCQVCLGEEISFNIANLTSSLMKTHDPTEENTNGKSKTDEFDMFGKSIAFQLRNISFGECRRYDTS